MDTITPQTWILVAIVAAVALIAFAAFEFRRSRQSQRLRARFGPGLHVMLITGETAPQRQQQMRDSGLQVLLKPVAADRLLQALASMTQPDKAPAGMRS